MYRLKFKQVLASLLSAAMILTAAPIAVQAENMSETMIETNDEMEDVEIIGAGNVGNLKWTVDKNQNLVITGELSKEDADQLNWGTWRNGDFNSFRYTIKTAKISVKGATDMFCLFSSMRELTSIDFSGSDFSTVTNMGQLFNGCSKLESVKFGNVDTSNVSNMSKMFYNCRSLTSVDFPSLNTSNVTDMSFMFENCESIKTLNLTKFNTSNVENFMEMFSGCKSIESLDVSSFDTSSAATFNNMFHGCSELKSLDLKNFNTANTTVLEALAGMFNGCVKLEKVDISSFRIGGCKNIEDMFNNCKSLKSIDMSSLDISDFFMGSRFSVFEDCSNLIMLKTPINVHSDIDLPADSKGDRIFYVEGSESDVWSSLPKDKTSSLTLVRKGTKPGDLDTKPENPEAPENPISVAENEINPVIFKEITIPFKEINLGLTKANSKKGIIGNNTITVIPSISSNNVMNKLVWAVDNKTIASVSNGKITAKKPGKAIVTVELKRGKEVLDRATIDVNVKDDSRIVLPNTFIDGNGTDIYDINIKAKGARGLLNAKADPNKGILLTVLGATTAKANRVKWESLDKTVATVASNGKVIGKKPGKTTIKATLDGKTYSYKIQVHEASISAGQVRHEITVGNKLDLAEQILNVSGADTDKSHILWMEGTKKQLEKMSLSKEGVVTAKGKGTVNVLAMINGVMVKFTIKIK